MTTSGEIINENGLIKFIAPNEVSNSLIIANVCNDKYQSTSDTIEVSSYKQLVFLKADDIRYHSYWGLRPEWITFVNYITEKNIKANIGLIGNSLDESGDAYNVFISKMKQIVDNENIEIWNHGYTHALSDTNDEGEIYHEFWNTPYEEQKEHLIKTQTLAKDLLGITLNGFGAPGNNNDENTVQALDEIPELKYWFYGIPDSNKLVFPRRIRIETCTGVPDYIYFVNSSYLNDDILILEIHPANWKDENWNEFNRTIDLLISQDATFMKVYDYWQLLNLE
jgi:peptidoglycan/xylan/chitin deacetylase (PgdA/CDA1 family)